jgi:hypothetical protein
LARLRPAPPRPARPAANGVPAVAAGRVPPAAPRKPARPAAPAPPEARTTAHSLRSSSRKKAPAASSEAPPTSRASTPRSARRGRGTRTAAKARGCHTSNATASDHQKSAHGPVRCQPGRAPPTPFEHQSTRRLSHAGMGGSLRQWRSAWCRQLTSRPSNRRATRSRKAVITSFVITALTC